MSDRQARRARRLDKQRQALAAGPPPVIDGEPPRNDLQPAGAPIPDRCPACGGRLVLAEELETGVVQLETGVVHAWIAHEDDCPALASSALARAVIPSSEDAKIPGGCDECDAYQTVWESDGVAMRTVVHDDSCPTWGSTLRRLGLGPSGSAA